MMASEFSPKLKHTNFTIGCGYIYLVSLVLLLLAQHSAGDMRCCRQLFKTAQLIFGFNLYLNISFFLPVVVVLLNANRYCLPAAKSNFLMIMFGTFWRTLKVL